MLRAIIVDDEELSVKRLKRLLSESKDIETCHTFMNPLEAYEYAKSSPVDVAFLDISMPELDGMALSGLLLDLDNAMDIVFVTGHDEYALQAFDASALDYLLKPVTAERLDKTLAKIRKNRGYTAAEPALSVFLFNGLRLCRSRKGQETIRLRSPKTEELFAFLMFRRAISREEIVDTLWSDLETDKALKNLNSTLYYIRKAIGSGQTGDCIEAGRHEIRIAESSLYCDLYEFERLLKQIRSAPEPSADLFKRAEVLYTGEFLKGKSYEWASEQTRRLEQDYIELLEAAARFHIGIHQPQQSLRYFCEILKLDAIREDISHEVIRLYTELGRKHEAFQQYRLLEQSLQQELGTRPDPRVEDFIMKLMR
ncbi:Protein-glutamate methylesterase/protein-glutamine glutaminase [Paenibacillus solanacearum]|uniref:Protein-glutamate methylesterase/protein-glutamine glutaminase n=1 Tax=Paenibacillus solanacearum TaxID=2048548 RepID=A0A916NRS4_9BACL|nr:response regulator [Paenibacillus solanacearum]CAG7645012.1 Protein-glutamate methylesterase/protein-glutamine glutaminase [Paenibacillus solanacearum]